MRVGKDNGGFFRAEQRFVGQGIKRAAAKTQLSFAAGRSTAPMVLAQ
jgi:hypothetical protein